MKLTLKFLKIFPHCVQFKPEQGGNIFIKKDSRMVLPQSRKKMGSGQEVSIYIRNTFMNMYRDADMRERKWEPMRIN